MATCDVTFNFSNIFFARVYVDSFQLQNQMAKHFVPYLLIIGLIFNLAFLFVVARLERMRTIPNFYLSMQATADCLYLMVQMGPTVWRVINLYRADPHNQGNWYNLLGFELSSFESRFGCFIEHFSYSFCYYVSLGVVIAVSYDRYLAIVHPLRYQRCKSRKHTFKVIAGILLFSLILGVSRGFMHSKHIMRCYVWPNSPEFDSFPLTGRYCRKLDNYITATINDLTSNATFITAMVLTTIFYANIVYQLSSRKVASNNTQVTLVRNQVARMVVITGCVFFLCQLPYRLYTTIRMVDRFTDVQISRTTNTILAYFGFGTHLYCAFNVLLFVLFNPFYRKACLEAFRCHATG